MKTKKIKMNRLFGLSLAALPLMLLITGCNLFGFLSSPSAFEEKVKPEFDIKAQSNQKVFVWVEPTPTSRADVEVSDLLAQSLGLQLIKKAGLKKSNVIIGNTAENQRDFFVKPEVLAEKAGAGMVLYVQLEQFELINMHSNQIYSGRIQSRSVLLDVKNGQILWPGSAGSRVTDIGIDMMAKGRDAMLSRLTAASAHCIVRNLYACYKTEYRVNEERSDLNEMIQQDVY